MKKFSLLIFLAALGGLTACHRHAAAPAPQIRPVLSMLVAPERAKGATFAGAVEPRYESSLSFRVLGRLVARDVSVGEKVEKGARIAALDVTPFQFALRNAEADLAKAEAQLKLARVNEARQRQLFSAGVNAKAEFETAQHELESAEAATVSVKANVAKVREQLGYAELRAEFSGVVTATGVEVGQVVHPGQEVVRVVRPEEREAVVDVPDDIALGLHPGIDFVVTPEAEPATQISGQIREISPQADPATRTRRVRISLAEPPLSLRLGSIVKAAAKISMADLEVPSSAVLERDGKTFVWLIDPGTNHVTSTEVKIGARHAESFQIAEGLAAGARVVTAGVHSLSSNQVVKILEAQP